MIDKFKMDLSHQLEAILPIKVEISLHGKRLSTHEHPPKILLYFQAETIITKAVDFLIKFYEEHKECKHGAK